MANSKRKCAYCKERVREYIVINTQAFCDYEHAAKYAYENRQKGAELIHRQKKKELKGNDIQLRKKSAQTAFNAYIRARDSGSCCISCDKPDNGSHQRHASHYRSVKACSFLRFNEDNVHASCMQCNSHMSGNITEYRLRLINKIGIDKVEWLECQNEPKRHTCEELKEIELKYKAKLKALSTSL